MNSTMHSTIHSNLNAKANANHTSNPTSAQKQEIAELEKWFSEEISLLKQKQLEIMNNYETKKKALLANQLRHSVSDHNSSS